MEPLLKFGVWTLYGNFFRMVTIDLQYDSYVLETKKKKKQFDDGGVDVTNDCRP